MPELPEVERVRKIFDRVLTGKKIAEAEVVEDEIVYGGLEPDYVKGLLEGRSVTGVGRKGKYFWLELDEKPWVFGHLGMSGWVRELGEETIRLKEHGKAPLDDENGRPRFLKLRLVTEDGREVAMTDGRRLARIWVSPGPGEDERVLKLGRDVYDDLGSVEELGAMIEKRKAPLKSLLLNQKLFCGVGNWIADEVMYHARISPLKLGKELSREEVGRLRGAIEMVVGLAVDADADYEKFPENWLFHYRWGGNKGVDEVLGHPIRRDQIGGRTTAWVPDLQK